MVVGVVGDLPVYHIVDAGLVLVVDISVPGGLVVAIVLAVFIVQEFGADV